MIQVSILIIVFHIVLPETVPTSVPHPGFDPEDRTDSQGTTSVRSTRIPGDVGTVRP